MMQIVPGPERVSRRTITEEPERHSGSELAALTPAERIALTIGLLNRGLDLIDQVARTSLMGSTRGTVRAQDNTAPEQHVLMAD